jgi:trans-2,3-dihydro-3-hydroxyanthranilate isomerase
VATLRYVTVDVFTDRVFGGNPLAVVLDAAGLSTARMQAIAAEFNYSETTFVLPPTVKEHAAQVRIFTPRAELPFAGHPNVGTAVCFAQECERQGMPIPGSLIFEERAGLVDIALVRSEGQIIGAEIRAPSPLTVGAAQSVEDAARTLSLSPSEVVTATHAPRVASVGLPFLMVELTSRVVLSRAVPDLAAHQRLLPALGTVGVFAYTRAERDAALHARMFAPLAATYEDPATGSASAALFALLASLRSAHDEEMSWQIEQGVDMGRPSLIRGRTEKRSGVVSSVYVSGSVVPVMEGRLRCPSD